MILIATTFSFILPGVYLFINQFFNGSLEFLYAIIASIMAAGIFHFFNVFIPERRRKKIIKENFKLNYTLFKEECIAIFLSTLDSSYESGLPKKLLSIEEFKQFFKEGAGGNETRWHGVINGLDKELLQKLNTQFEILSQEIDFFLNNVSLHDKEIFSFSYS